MENPPPAPGTPTDPSATQTEKREGEVLNQGKTEMSSSKLVGKKRQNLQTKKMLKKKERKVQKMAAKVADMRAKTSSLRRKMDEMNAAAEEKKKEVAKLEKEKLDGLLTEYLLMSVTEHVLMEILFPPSGNY